MSLSIHDWLTEVIPVVGCHFLFALVIFNQDYRIQSDLLFNLELGEGEWIRTFPNPICCERNELGWYSNTVLWSLILTRYPLHHSAPTDENLINRKNKSVNHLTRMPHPVSKGVKYNNALIKTLFPKADLSMQNRSTVNTVRKIFLFQFLSYSMYENKQKWVNSLD